jgi:hypothetical protein
MSWTSTTVVKLHISLNHHTGHKTEAKGNHTPEKVTDYIDLYKGKAKVYMSTPWTMPIDNLSERTLEVAWKEETICRYGMYIHNKKGWPGWGVTLMQNRCLLKKRPSFMIWYSLKEATELLKHRWAMAVKRVPGPWLLGCKHCSEHCQRNNTSANEERWAQKDHKFGKTIAEFNYRMR